MVNRPNRVILHCSATPDYAPGADFDLFGAADIDAWHKAQGWSEIGYHWVVRRTGLVEVGRDEKRYGAHTKGENTDSLGVCYIGRQYPTEEQLQALGTLFMALRVKYGIEADDWYPHYEFNPAKTCPGFSIELFRAYLKGLC